MNKTFFWEENEKEFGGEEMKLLKIMANWKSQEIEGKNKKIILGKRFGKFKNV